MAARAAASHAARHSAEDDECKKKKHESAECKKKHEKRESVATSPEDDEIIHEVSAYKKRKWLRRTMTDVVSVSFSHRSLPGQNWVKQYYETPKVQVGVAGLIFGNFIVSATAAQILPEKGELADVVFYYFDWFFNAAFLIELLWNMYGNFFLSFWKSGWNVFDFFIVGVSVTSLVFPDLPGVGVLRLFRAFRVFRLFKRIKSLRLIIVGVVMSLEGVMNAFIVLLLFLMIWGIMGVDFFGDDFEEQYGSFYVASLTQFQILTLDSWASGVARPIMDKLGPFHAIFFITYVFINSIMMVNVVVAILLDKFVAAMKNMEDEDKEEAADKDEGPSPTIHDQSAYDDEEEEEADAETQLINHKLSSVSNYATELSSILSLALEKRGLTT